MQYTDTAVIPNNEGRARMKGLDLNWTSASPVNKTNTFGNDIISANTGQPTRLAGRPRYDSLTLTTPNTKAAQRKIRAWLKTPDAQPGKVAATAIITDVYWSFTACTISQEPVFPGFDANSDNNATNFISMQIEITRNSRVEVTNQ